MTFIHVFTKDNGVTHTYMHWREAMHMLEGGKEKGEPVEFILIDKERKRIISSQNCFRILDLSPKTVQTFLTEYEVEEL